MYLLGGAFLFYATARIGAKYHKVYMEKDDKIAKGEKAGSSFDF